MSKSIIKRSLSELDPVSGTVADTWNVQDKVHNAPSERIVEEALSNRYTKEQTMSISEVMNYAKAKSDFNLQTYTKTLTKTAGNATFTFLKRGNIVKVKVEVNINAGEVVSSMLNVSDLPDWAKTNDEDGNIIEIDMTGGSFAFTGDNSKRLVAFESFAKADFAKLNGVYKLAFIGNNPSSNDVTLTGESLYFV